MKRLLFLILMSALMTAFVPAAIIQQGTASTFASALDNAQIVATGTLSANKYVVAYIYLDGTKSGGGGGAVPDDIRFAVATVSGTSVSFGPVVTLSGVAGSEFLEIEGMTSNRFVIAYATSDGKGVTRLATVTGNAITFHNTAEFHNNFEGTTSLLRMTDDRFILIHTYNGGKGQSRTGKISGTTITYGSKKVFMDPKEPEQWIALARLSDTEFVAAYTETDKAYAVVGTRSTSNDNLSYGSAYQFASNMNTNSWIGMDAISPSQVVIAWQDPTSSADGLVRTGNISGTAITYGANTVFESTFGVTQDLRVGAFQSPYFLLTYSDTTPIGKGTAVLGTVSGTGVSLDTSNALTFSSSMSSSAIFNTTMLSSTVAAVGYVKPVSLSIGDGNSRLIYLNLDDPPTVSNVSVSGLLRVDVTFSEAIAGGALTATNYTLTGSRKGTLTAKPDSVQYLGGNIYRLVWNAGEMLDGGDITITVAGVQDSGGNNIGTPDNGTDLLGGEGTAPTVSNVTVVSSNQIQLTFSEDMAASINTAAWYTLSGSAKGLLSTNPTSITVSSPNQVLLNWSTGTLVPGIATITAANVTDLAGNMLGSPNSGSDTFGLGAGSGPPTVNSVDVSDLREILIIFSEAVSAGATTPANYTISGAGKGTLAAHPDAVQAVSSTKYRLTWTAGEMFRGGSVTITAANIYDTSSTLIGDPDNGTDVAGGLGVEPSVVSVSVVAPNQIHITFNEAMSSSISNPTIYTLNGTAKGTLASQPTTATVLSSTEALLEWTSGSLADGMATVTVSAGAADAAGTPIGNPNDGSDVYTGAAPYVTGVAVADERAVIISFNETVVGATDPANYTLSGTGQGTMPAMPDRVVYLGASFYYLAWDSGEMAGGADITITVANIQDTAGNPIGNPDNGTDTTGSIGTAPTVTSVAVVSGTVVDIAFDEAMNDDALLVENYTLTGTGIGTATPNPDSVVDLGGNVYRLTWTVGAFADGVVTITAANVGDAAGNLIGTPDSGSDSYAFSTSGPQITAVTANSTRSIVVSFDRAMGNGVLTPSNYFISGPGEGSLALQPDSIVAMGLGTSYRLVWNAGEMVDSTTMIVTAYNVESTAGEMVNPYAAKNGMGKGVAPVMSTLTVAASNQLRVTFSEAMGAGSGDVANYEISGAGIGTLATSPDSMVDEGNGTFLLSWVSGSLGNGVVTLTAQDVSDEAGNGIGTPNSASATAGTTGVNDWLLLND